MPGWALHLEAVLLVSLPSLRHDLTDRERHGIQLGMPRLAGADLHPHVASGAHDVPLPLGGVRGAQPPASPCRGPAERGPKG